MAKKRKNPNGEGTIYKIESGPKKGSWMAQLTVGKYPKTGKPKRKSFRGKTRGEAKRKMEDYMDQIGLGLDMETAQSLTCGEWLLQWLDLYKRPFIRLSTYENYLMYIENHIHPAIGDIPLADLDSDHIQAIYNKMQDAGKAPATIAKVHRIIHACLDKAVEKDYILKNYSDITERPSVISKKGEAMSEEDMDKFLDVVHEQTDKWKAAMLTLLGTGVRIGELLALEWNEVDFESRTINIKQGLSRTKSKGLIVEDPKSEASKADVPVPGVVLDALKQHKSSQAELYLYTGRKYPVTHKKSKHMQEIYEDYPRLDSYPISRRKCECNNITTTIYKTDEREIFRCEECGKEWQRHSHNLVFPSVAGTHITPRNFQRKYYDLLEEAQVPHIKLHGLRHTFATRLLEQGENLKVVQELLRHTDIKTTANIYSHVSPKVKKKAAHKMDNLLKPRTKENNPS
jgi:integrase